MGYIDNYDGYTSKKGDGQDEKGKFIEYVDYYEAPCGCHPETCSHFGRRDWKSQRYRRYEDGSVVYL